DTILDAITIGNIFIEMYPGMKNIINSYMNGKRYMDNVDIKTKLSMINDVMLCENKDDAFDLIYKLSNKTNDDICRKTMERISLLKENKKIESKKIITLANKNINKECPHCGHIANMPENTMYVICGYTSPN